MIAIICEMFHTSSLLHDDVIDHAETRRGKMSVNTKWSQASSIQAGVYILATSTKLLAQTKHPEVIIRIFSIRELLSPILWVLIYFVQPKFCYSNFIASTESIEIKFGIHIYLPIIFQFYFVLISQSINPHKSIKDSKSWHASCYN